MILLPDINIDGHILSIHEPYLLDGYIITDIERRMSYDIFQDIVIKNENNQCLTVSSEELEYKFMRKMSDFISTYGRGAFVEGRSNIDDWTNYTSEKYLNEMYRQCSNCNRFGQNYIGDLKAKLRRQGRDYFEPHPLISRSYEYIRQSDPYHISCNHNDNYVLSTDAIRSCFSNNSLSYDTFLNTSTNNENTYTKKYIHSHNYKPEYTHYYMPNEDKDTTLLLGAEIEVDCGGQSEEHAKEVLGIMCGNDSLNSSVELIPLETKMYCMRDGSLTNGIEFATMPCSLEYHKQNMEYRKMFKYLVKNGYKAHDTNTCGLHIHANRSYLGKTELVQQLTISKILYILEKFNDEVCVIARRNSRYSQFVGAGKNETSVIELYGKYKDKNKYVALNMQHSETIEFRCFKGTLKYETFILTLEFVKDMIDYAKSINIEEIELIQWDDLMNTFSNELKNYYNERLEKERKKKEEKDVNNNSSWYTIADINGNNLNLRSLSNHAFVIDDAHSLSAYRRDDSFDSLRYAYQNSLLGRNVADCSSCVTININDDIQQAERTVLDELKHKEKSLKKQIKHAINFMEKKRLEIELKEIQKEIKKEKKRIKLNNTNNIAS